MGSRNGGENDKVSEHSVVVIFELEAYPEPKILSSIELQELLKTHSYRNLAKALGCSIGFIYERCSKKQIRLILLGFSKVFQKV
jgi:hypothetical protein